MDNYEKLNELKKLLDKGLIKDDEYQVFKNAIIEDIKEETLKNYSNNEFEVRDKSTVNTFKKFIIIGVLLISCYFLCKIVMTKSEYSVFKFNFLNSKLNDNINNKEKEFFQGQELKIGEKIIKMNWGMENKIHLTRDHGFGHFVSPIMIVPSGKKWVMLYSMENYKFNNSGLELSMVPNLSVDNNIKEVYGMLHEDKNKINLSKAKDENVKYYSGSRIQAISNREKSNYDGEDFDNYNGEIWFLEFNQ